MITLYWTDDKVYNISPPPKMDIDEAESILMFLLNDQIDAKTTPVLPEGFRFEELK